MPTNSPETRNQALTPQAVEMSRRELFSLFAATAGTSALASLCSCSSERAPELERYQSYWDEFYKPLEISVMTRPLSGDALELARIIDTTQRAISRALQFDNYNVDENGESRGEDFSGIVDVTSNALRERDELEAFALARARQIIPGVYSYQDLILARAPEYFAPHGVYLTNIPIALVDKSDAVLGVQFSCCLFEVKKIETRPLPSGLGQSRINNISPLRIDGHLSLALTTPPAFAERQQVFIDCNRIEKQLRGYTETFESIRAQPPQAELTLSPADFLRSIAHLPPSTQVLEAAAFCVRRACGVATRKSISHELLIEHTISHELRHVDDYRAGRKFFLHPPLELDGLTTLGNFNKNWSAHNELNGVLGELRDSPIPEIALIHVLEPNYVDRNDAHYADAYNFAGITIFETTLSLLRTGAISAPQPFGRPSGVAEDAYRVMLIPEILKDPARRRALGDILFALHHEQEHADYSVWGR